MSIDTFESQKPWMNFVESLHHAAADLGEPMSRLWFRGHAGVGHALIPSLLRYPRGTETEQSMFEEYVRSAARLMPTRENDWERLFDMQHYGIPTRLLDWTEKLGIAIAFALYDSRGDAQDSELFVLNPYRLNGKSGRSTVREATLDPTFDFAKMYWEGIPVRPTHPIAFRPQLQNDRLAAQRGTFTVHGSDPRPVDVLAPDCVRRITLHSSAKAGARQYLEYFGDDPSEIYPDMHGMAKHLVRKYLEGS